MKAIRNCAAATVLLSALVLAAGYGVKPGRYLGKWEGGSSGGKLEMNVTGSDGQATSADVVFTYEDRRVPTMLRRFAVAGQAIEIVYDFDLGGATLQSTLKGELRENKLTGTYRTTAGAAGEQVDQGTWEATRED